MGAPSTSQLLSEVKATAAAVGGIGVLIDLLRCEQKMQVQQAHHSIFSPILPVLQVLLWCNAEL
jgi:hypothetical protein